MNKYCKKCKTIYDSSYKKCPVCYSNDYTTCYSNKHILIPKSYCYIAKYFNVYLLMSILTFFWISDTPTRNALWTAWIVAVMSLIEGLLILMYRCGEGFQTIKRMKAYIFWYETNHLKNSLTDNSIIVIKPPRFSRIIYFMPLVSLFFALILSEMNNKYFWVFYLLYALFEFIRIISLGVGKYETYSTHRESFSKYYEMVKTTTEKELKLKLSSEEKIGAFKGLFGIFLIIMAIVAMFKACSGGNSYTKNGICDKAGCSKSATCEVRDTEWCLKHYMEMFPLSDDN